MDLITAHGMRMPKLGLGTWKLKGAECTEAVQRAVAMGYRHVDTAEMYGNEDAVGEALAHAAVPRSEVDISVSSAAWASQTMPLTWYGSTKVSGGYTIRPPARSPNLELWSPARCFRACPIASMSLSVSPQRVNSMNCCSRSSSSSSLYQTSVSASSNTDFHRCNVRQSS